MRRHRHRPYLPEMMGHPDVAMRLTALRLLEVRRAYAAKQFDFAGVHTLAVKELGAAGPHRTRVVRGSSPFTVLLLTRVRVPLLCLQRRTDVNILLT